MIRSIKLTPFWSEETTVIGEFFTWFFTFPLWLTGAYQCHGTSIIDNIGFYAMALSIRIIELIRAPCDSLTPAQRLQAHADGKAVDDPTYWGWNLVSFFHFLLLCVPLAIVYPIGGLIGIVAVTIRDVFQALSGLPMSFIKLIGKCCDTDWFDEHEYHPFKRIGILGGCTLAVFLVVLGAGSDSFFVVGAEFAVTTVVAGISAVSDAVGFGAITVSFTTLSSVILGTALGVIALVLAGKMLGALIDHCFCISLIPALAVAERRDGDGQLSTALDKTGTPSPTRGKGHRGSIRLDVPDLESETDPGAGGRDTRSHSEDGRGAPQSSGTPPDEDSFAGPGDDEPLSQERPAAPPPTPAQAEQPPKRVAARMQFPFLDGDHKAAAPGSPRASARQVLTQSAAMWGPSGQPPLPESPRPPKAPPGKARKAPLPESPRPSQ